MNNLPILHKSAEISVQKTSDFDGYFQLKPLEPGFGNTIGNALKDILLASEGFAISSIKIAGVQDRFASIPGVEETVTEIILNLKQVRFFSVVADENILKETICFTLSGQEQFRAEDIGDHTNIFKIINPELVICTMDSSVSLEVELTITKGRGTLPADENIENDGAMAIIPIDAVYTPIRNLCFSVKNIRVEERTDYEKLTIELSTDGTIYPEYAIKEAAKIFIQHLELIYDPSEEVPQYEECLGHPSFYVMMRKLLNTLLENLDFSAPTYKSLKAANINSVAELVQYDKPELLQIKYFGQTEIDDVEEVLAELGLTYGMDLSKYRLLDED